MQRQEGLLQEKDTGFAVLASMKGALNIGTESFAGLSSENRICDEMIVEIISKLPPADLARVAKTDRQFRGLANEMLANRIKHREPQALGLYSSYCQTLFTNKLERPKNLLTRHTKVELESAQEEANEKANNIGFPFITCGSLALILLSAPLGGYAHDSKEVAYPAFFITTVASLVFVCSAAMHIKKLRDSGQASIAAKEAQQRKTALERSINDTEKLINDFSSNPEDNFKKIARNITELEKRLQNTSIPSADIWDLEAGRRSNSSRP